MFENSGKVVKALAIVGFWLTLVISIIIAISSFFSINPSPAELRWGLLLKGLKHLFVVPVVAWISSVIVYCIGDTNEKLTEAGNKTEE